MFDTYILAIFFLKEMKFSISSALQNAGQKYLGLENKDFGKSSCKSWTMSFLAEHNQVKGVHISLFKLNFF